MSSIVSFLYRIYTAFVSPPIAPKQHDAIRFGLLGASTIAPMAIIGPAKSHPEVIIAAVAARDKDKAEVYAKQHDIPIVHSTYQELIDDPTISCIYIALPNSHHFEWALRSLQAGKHVLLEKPSCSNASEAHILFNHPLLHTSNPPVLLEAFHYRFHPAWQTFLSLIHHHPLAGNVISAYSCQYLWKGHLEKGHFFVPDIRFQYALSGGCLMDFGTYNLSCLRQILGVEPEVVEASYRGLPKAENEQKEIDTAIKATYMTKGGAIATLDADLSKTGGWPSFLPSSWTKDWPSFGWPKCVVELEEKEVDSDVSQYAGESHMIQRKVTLWNHLMPTIYHRIDVLDTHIIRRVDDSVLKTWTEFSKIKAYTWPNDGDNRKTRVGANWWSTYRYQLEEFVNKIKGREGSGVWVDGEDSVAQMEAIDRTYEKAGLRVRPKSDFSL